ncbi:beta-galactosidase GalB [Carboxylicivirga sp. RSCT41]|uniref:beta-galactosidase GalB n=1 Tax=Carboxylicivirga agarovorans TaxID=3417570 RepID=UPI003D342306
MPYITTFIICLLITIFHSCSPPQDRLRESFNEDWLFSKDETGQEHQGEFNDAQWRKLSLPHDWAIEGPFDKKHDTRTGGLPVYGTAWYRKHFFMDVSHTGKHITVEFDGVMNNAEIFLNGQKVGQRPFGYMGFEVDLTPYIRYGQDNVLAVRVNPEELSARWYPGAGIYRNVWLEIKNPVHVAHWGTYITTPQVDEHEALVNIETTIENKQLIKGKFSIETYVIDTLGHKVAYGKDDIEFGEGKQAVLKQQLSVKKPQRWDLDNTYLYKVLTKLKKDGVYIDNYESSFGIRTIDYTKEKGFLLNNKPINFKGVCLHHDLGPLGAAVNYRATERQLEIMKEIGVNAIRTAHNPPSPEQLELCDKMGILVQVEAFDEWKLAKVENGYSKYWDEWHERDLRDMIKRDRNHPSVVMWSIGNEIKEQRKKNGGKMAKYLVDICHDEDPTRPVTAGFNHYPQCMKNGLADAVDLVGFNYKPTQYDNAIRLNPDYMVYGAETSSVVSSRGVYHLPNVNYEKHESLQVTSYDIVSPPWAYPPDFETYAQETMPHSLGEFVWTGFDYLGEPTPYNGKDNITHGKWGGDWPSRSSYFGIVDLCGFPKDRYYYYQSIWTTEPMVHILPHWNWEGTTHQTIPVYCYTNCDEAELFLNGQSQGKKVMGEDKTTIPAEFLWWKRTETTWDSPYRLNWNVRYEPGELKVVAYKNGEAIAEKTIVTAGQPNQIKLSPDRKVIHSDGYDLSFLTVCIEDADGNVCPLADNLVNFTIEGPAVIAAVGNGNAASTEPFQANYRKAFNGLCMLVIKSLPGQSGSVQIEASATGLKAAKTELVVK